MSEPTDPADEEDDFFDLDVSEFMDNKRKAIRYVRPDIKAILLTKKLFFSYETVVTLIDLSSKGAQIVYPQKLARKSKVTLYLIFPDKRKFSLNATVVHCTAAQQYGLKFNKISDELGEHLLSSQDDLIFK